MKEDPSRESSCSSSSKYGSARIHDITAMVNIQLAAKYFSGFFLQKKYKVGRYADKATGSASGNQKLSEKRAQAVYDALIKEGVDKGSNLELVGIGWYSTRSAKTI